jgi:hypothetical protein
MMLSLSRRLRAEILEQRTLLAADFTNWAESQAASPAQSVQPSAADVAAYIAGDANRDGRFDQLDVLNVLQAGKYLSGQSADWSEGDWNGDGRFDQHDIVMALKGNDFLDLAYDARARIKRGTADVTRATPGRFGSVPDTDPPEFFDPTGQSPHSSFRRATDGFSFNLHTNNLPPGTYTVWMVVFANQTLCSDTCGGDDVFVPEQNNSVFYVDGGVVHENGVGNFHASAKLGEFPGEVLLPGAWGDRSADPSTAEYHGIIRYHGPASDDPDVLYAQTHTFEGGCDVFACYDPQALAFVR